MSEKKMYWHPGLEATISVEEPAMNRDKLLELVEKRFGRTRCMRECDEDLYALVDDVAALLSQQEQEPIGWIGAGQLEAARTLVGSVSLWLKRYPDSDVPLYLAPYPAQGWNEAIEAAKAYVRGRFAGRQQGSDVWLELGKIERGLDALARPSQAQEPDYEAIEREHLGDADKRTGIYAPQEQACMTCLGAGIVPTGDGCSVDACPECNQEQLASGAVDSRPRNWRAEYVEYLKRDTSLTDEDKEEALRLYDRDSQPSPVTDEQDDSLLLCASDLQHSAIYDNHSEMQSCVRAVADRITALSAQEQVELTDAVIEAAKNLITVKGRYHSEQAYQRLADAVALLSASKGEK